MVLIFVTAFFFQPDVAMLQHLFEEALSQRRSQYGRSDLRTGEAARDLGLFLARQGDTSGARIALAEAVRIDTRVAGPKAGRTLAAVAELASVSPPQEALPLWRQAAGSSDPAIAARALAALGALHEQ